MANYFKLDQISVKVKVGLLNKYNKTSLIQIDLIKVKSRLELSLAQLSPSLFFSLTLFSTFGTSVSTVDGHR